MTFDADAAQGYGGAVVTDDDADLTTDAVLDLSSGFTAGFVLHLATYTANDSIWSLGGSAFGGSNSRILHVPLQELTWGRSEASSFPQVTPGYGANDVEDFQIVIIRANSTSSMDFFGRSLTPSNIDPQDSAVSADRYVWIGDRGVGDDGHAGDVYCEHFITDAILTDAHCKAIMKHWSREYGVPLI